MKNLRFSLPLELHGDGAECPDDEFRFDAVIASGNLDDYHSRLNTQTLDNFVKQINERGVSLLDSHGHDSVNKVIGRWYQARRDGDKVIATASMLRSTDKTPDNLNVDEIIRRVERGHIKDVSVGFLGGEQVCDICEGDIFKRGSGKRCRHWPGQVYDIGGQEKTCTFEVRNAKLAETSLVFDGANADAQIINVRNAPQELIDWKEGDENPDLSMLEEYGVRYQKQLIDELISEAVRAIGHGFDEDKQRAKYMKWPVQDVMEQIDVFKRAQNIQGGRKIEGGTADNNPAKMPTFIYG